MSEEMNSKAGEEVVEPAEAQAEPAGAETNEPVGIPESTKETENGTEEGKTEASDEGLHFVRTNNVEEEDNPANHSRSAWRKHKRQLKKAAKAEKKIADKLEKKARKVRWKEAKKERRRELKEKYKDAPWIIRVPRLYLLKPFIIGIIAIVALTIFGSIGVGVYFLGRMIYLDDLYDNRNAEVKDKDLLYEQSPIDEEGAAKIASYAPIGSDETWTVCVYFIASNLEDYDENDLSITTYLQTKKEREERNDQVMEKRLSLLERYSDDLKKNGLNLPEYLYYPEKPVASSYYDYGDTVITEEDGAATTDIYEMLGAELSDNIRIVIQTGGATRWSDSLINPNKTQRFEINKDGMKEIENLPLQRATDPDTLADFMTYCEENYPSDHRMLVLWDHGNGPFGYGSDSIYGGESMTLKDIRAALEKVYKPSEKNPAFDIIGFDACLMSSLEVTHALYGFADFYALSAEVEPGDGWDYTPFLQKMSDEPTLSAAAVAREIADTYMDCYMTQNVNIKKIMTQDVTFSVVDAVKAEEVYKAYCELAEKQLEDSAEDISVLAEIGRCCNKSTHYIASEYSIMNLTDLGNYMTYMSETYPEECGKISALLEEAVLYHRENGSLCDSSGMSLYIPGSIDSYYGLDYFLKYEYEVCEDNNIRALYFYKMAGCLNDEMKEDVLRLSGTVPKNLDVSLFDEFEDAVPDIDGKKASIKISDELKSMIQNYSYELATYDEDDGYLTYYGVDDYTRVDENGNVYCDFDGKWICLDGEHLGVEITSSSSVSTEYRSKILYNGKDAYLIISLNRETGEYSIKGVREIPVEADDEINFLVNSKSNIELQPGDKIVPIYGQVNTATGNEYEVEGKKITFGIGSKVEKKNIESGYYLGMMVVDDQRGDSYYSAVLGYTVSGGKVKECKIDNDFIGSGY